MFKTALLCATCLAAPTLAAADQWYGETGQGVRSASIEHDGIYLGVNCVTTAANVVNSVTLSHRGQAPTATISFTFDYDDSTFLELPFVAGTFVADTTNKQRLFSRLVQSLKAGRWVEVLDPPAGELIVPLKGSGNALAGCE